MKMAIIYLLSGLGKGCLIDRKDDDWEDNHEIFRKFRPKFSED